MQVTQLSQLPAKLASHFDSVELEAWDRDNIAASGADLYHIDLQGSTVKLEVNLEVDRILAGDKRIPTYNATAKIEPPNEKVLDVVTKFFNPPENEPNIVYERVIQWGRHVEFKLV